MTSFAASLLTFTQDSKILAVKKIKREQITLGAKNAQGDSEVDRSRSGMHFPVSLHFSGIPMDVVSHVGAPFFRRNEYTVERLRLVSDSGLQSSGALGY